MSKSLSQSYYQKLQRKVNVFVASDDLLTPKKSEKGIKALIL